ncbi:MAG: hypothetical protein V4450_15120 [Bacteroidota bacterium]
MDFFTLYLSTLKQQNFEYLTKHKSRSFTDVKQRITYSFNNQEHTIIGQMEEDGTNICLYEYRGKYIGTEFLISFSKNSVSYKLINVDEGQNELLAAE